MPLGPLFAVALRKSGWYRSDADAAAAGVARIA
jgi:hypothetical protein